MGRSTGSNLSAEMQSVYSTVPADGIERAINAFP